MFLERNFYSWTQCIMLKDHWVFCTIWHTLMYLQFLPRKVFSILRPLLLSINQKAFIKLALSVCKVRWESYILKRSQPILQLKLIVTIATFGLSMHDLYPFARLYCQTASHVQWGRHTAPGQVLGSVKTQDVLLEAVPTNPAVKNHHHQKF